MRRATNPKGWLDTIVGSALGLFLATVLLYYAVQVVDSIKWWLLGGLVVVLIGGLITGAIRYHRDHW